MFRTLLLALGLALPAAAQPTLAELFPLTEGNRWTFDNSEYSSFTGTTSERGQTSWEVTGTADTPDGALPVLEIVSPSGTVACAVRGRMEDDPAGDVYVYEFLTVDGASACDAGTFRAPGPSFGSGVWADDLSTSDVDINGVVYPDRTVGYGSWVPDGPQETGQYTAVVGIGIVSFSVQDDFGPGVRVFSSGLRSAEVDGVTYGSVANASDDTPDEPALSLAVAPNPARGAARLTFSGQAAARIVVLDAMGRVARTFGVAPGAVEVDLGGLGAGVYLVRAETARGVASTRLTVVR